jgi:ParB family chromosome partitioning protein
MSRKKIVLGKNLVALNLKELTSEKNSYDNNTDTKNDNGLCELETHKLVKGKYQPRHNIDQSSLEELAQSIKNQGIIQPIVVRKIDNDQYEILAGERRHTAAKLAGLKSVPVIIKDIDDQSALAIALIENLQREDLNAIEEARAIDRLIKEFELTHQQAADTLGKSRTTVSNLLRLLSLHTNVQDLLENGAIEMGHARALLSLSPVQQCEIANLIVTRNLTVRDVEHKVKNFHKQIVPTIKLKTVPEELIKYQNILTDVLQLPLNVKPFGSTGSKITITCRSKKEIENLLSILQHTESA